MKKIIIPVLMLGLTLTNCKNNSNENNEVVSGVEANDISFNDSIDSESAIISDESGETETENWDIVIDEYESFIDQYIEVMKKVKAGDMSAASDLTSMQEQAQSLGEKLENAEKELTPEQMKRFVKLQTKISNAAVDLM